MSENLPNIDDLFRRALEEHEEAPSPNMWANLDKNLDKKKVVFISKKYRKLKWVAAALLIFSAGMAMYTWNTRLKNKELVKQNEMNKKKASTATTPLGGNMSTDADKAGLADSAIVDGTPKVAKDKPLADTAETEDEKGISGADNPVVEAIEKQNENKFSKTADKGAKVTGKTRFEDVTGSNKNELVAKEKRSSILASQTRENGVTEKQANANAAAERKNKVIAADAKSTGAQDESVLEKAKREVEITTAHEREKNLGISEPGKIEPGRTSEIFNENNKEIAAFKKSSVKPFRSPKFSATAIYSKDFIAMKVENDRHAFREDDRNEIKSKEKISNSSSAGVLLNYSIGNNWNIQSGLVFSSMTTDIQPKQIFARADERGNVYYRFNCSAGYSFVTLKTGAMPTAGDSVTALSSRNTLHYIAVPIGFAYNVYIGKFSLQPGAGLAFNFLTKGKIETEIRSMAGNEKATLDKIEGLNTSYLNGSLSLSGNYYLTKNLALNITPSARFALGGINKEAPVKTYLNSFGLGAGLTVRF